MSTFASFMEVKLTSMRLMPSLRFSLVTNVAIHVTVNLHSALECIVVTTSYETFVNCSYFFFQFPPPSSSFVAHERKIQIVPCKCEPKANKKSRGEKPEDECCNM